MSNELPGEPLPPDTASVGVWTARLDREPSELRRLAGSLSNDEHARAERFVFEVHRRRFVAARGLLRALLGRELGVAPAALVFDYAAWGKPRLDPRHGGELHFNVSHSHDLGVLALARGRELGVDVEAVRVEIDHAAIAARFFSPAEQSALQALPAPERAAGFFTIWTRKEAYLKLVGAGLRLALDSFDVSLDEPARLLRVDGAGGAADGARLVTLAAPAGFRAALALTGPPASVRNAVL